MRLLGSVIGALLGWATAIGIATAAQRLWQEGFEPAQLSALPVVIGLALGVSVTVLAAVRPALHAGHASPMAALRPVDVAPEHQRVHTGRVVLEILLTVGGLAAVLLAAVLPEPLFGVAGAMLGFTGVLLMGRRLLPAAVSGLGRVVASWPWLRVPGRLAAQNARAVLCRAGLP